MVRPNDIAFALSIVAGIVCGIVATFALVYAGIVLSPMASPITAPGTQSVARIYRIPPVTWAFLIELIIVVALTVLAFTLPALQSANRNVRAILISALFVMLGGMSLCNLVSFTMLPR